MRSRQHRPAVRRLEAAPRRLSRRASARCLPAIRPMALDRVFCLCRGQLRRSRVGRRPKGIDRILDAQRTLKSSGLSSSLADLTVAMDVAESYRMAGRNREAGEAFRPAYAQMTALGRGEHGKGRDAAQQLGPRGRHSRPAARGRSSSIAGHPDQQPRREGEQGVSAMLLNNLARALKDLDRFPKPRRRPSAHSRSALEHTIRSSSISPSSFVHGVYRELHDFARSADLARRSSSRGFGRCCRPATSPLLR